MKEIKKKKKQEGEREIVVVCEICWACPSRLQQITTTRGTEYLGADQGCEKVDDEAEPGSGPQTVRPRTRLCRNFWLQLQARQGNWRFLGLKYPSSLPRHACLLMAPFAELGRVMRHDRQPPYSGHSYLAAQLSVRTTTLAKEPLLRVESFFSLSGISLHLSVMIR